MATRSYIDDMPPLLDSDTDEDDCDAHSESDLPPLLQDSSGEEDEGHVFQQQRNESVTETEEQRTLRLYALLSANNHERDRTKLKKNEELDEFQQRARDQKAKEREQKAKERERKEKERQLEEKERKRTERLEQKEAKTQARKVQELKELFDSCNDNLRKGIDYYVTADYKNALSPLQFAGKLLEKIALTDTAAVPRDSARYELISSYLSVESRHLIRYLTTRCAFETDHDHTREKHILGEIDSLLIDFPAPYVYWLYGRAMNQYQPRNERTATYLSRAVELSCELEKHQRFAYDIVFESNSHHLQSLIDDEFQVWRKRPAPDGICDNAACSSPKLYWGDDELHCARILCSQGHRLLYHKSCWRNVAKKIYGSKSRDKLIGENCLVDDCNGDVTRYDDLTSSGAVRNSYEAAPSKDKAAPNDHADKKEEEDKKEDDEEYDARHESLCTDKHNIETSTEASQDDDKDEDIGDRERLPPRKPLIDAFTIDLSDATVILPRDKASTTTATVGKKKKRKEKVASTMSLGEFWKTEEEKEAIRETERLALKAQRPAFERDLDDLHNTVKVLARRPTKKLSRNKAASGKEKEVVGIVQSLV